MAVNKELEGGKRAGKEVIKEVQKTPGNSSTSSILPTNYVVGTTTQPATSEGEKRVREKKNDHPEDIQIAPDESTNDTLPS